MTEKRQKDKILLEDKAKDLMQKISSGTKDFKKKTSSLVKELDKEIKDEQQQMDKFEKDMADFEKKHGEEIEMIALQSISQTDIEK
jgi:hypothetical protein